MIEERGRLIVCSRPQYIVLLPSLMPPAKKDQESEYDSDEEDQLDQEDYILSSVLRPSRPVSYSIEKLYGMYSFSLIIFLRVIRELWLTMNGSFVQQWCIVGIWISNQITKEVSITLYVWNVRMLTVQRVSPPSSGFVWPETKQISIIDSILRNYYIPPVIFHVITDDTGDEKRVAIGQSLYSL